MPESHPIHTPAEARTDRSAMAMPLPTNSMTCPRGCQVPTSLHLSDNLVNGRCHIDRSAMAMLGVIADLHRTVTPMDVPDHVMRTRMRELLATLEAQIRAHTPAEERTGVSDRAAAVLNDVAHLRRVLLKSLHPRLDRIEAALREQR